METILVTGANGLVGQKIVDVLAERAAVQVVATGRGPNRNSAGGFRYERADLSEAAEVAALMQRVQPTTIIHCAGLTLPDACERDPAASHLANVVATSHVVAAAQQLGAYLIQLSTDFVFDGTAGPYRETDTPNPLSVYGRDKLTGEQLVQEAASQGLRAAIVRTVLVYGWVPGMQRRSFALWVRESLTGGTPIQVVADQYRTPTLAEDLADGVVACWARRKTGLYHVSGAELVSVFEFAQKVALHWGLDANLIAPVPTASLNEAAVRPPRTGFVILKAQTELDYKPRSLADGLALVARQVKAGGKT